ncbi:MAG: efflux RND transporter periplasmic adaptor subunit [bacterium]
MREPFRRAAVPLLLAALAVAAIGCGSKKADPKDAAKAAGRGVPVTIAAAVAKDVPVTIEAIGTVEAYNTVSVRSQVGGELTKVGFVEGKSVSAGDILFTIDTRPYEAALQAALADSAKSAAMAASADAQEARYADLVKKDYVTKQDYDDVKASAEASRAVVLGAAAATRTARLNLEFCTIRAPISGRTGSLLVHQGNLVKANDTVALVVIQQIVPVYVSFSIPERSLTEARRFASAGELTVRATASGDSAVSHAGKLSFIDNAVDETTGTILLKATFPNADQALWPGQFVNVAMVLSTRKGAVVIPVRALQKSQRGDFVYLVQADGTVKSQPITAGARLDEEVVIEQGVRNGDRVVTDGQLRLVPGAKVDEKKAASAPAPPSGKAAS